VTLYLYAIADVRPRGPLGRGLGGHALAVVTAAGAFVVVERTAAPEPTPTRIRAHDRVVRRIAKQAPAVLPLRFGALVEDAAALRALLEPTAEALRTGLERVRNCVQYTHRVYGTAQPASATESGAGPGARWLAQRVAARRVPEAEPIARATKPFVREARVERHDRPPLVASVYHLVPRGSVKGYRAALARGAAALDGVRVETTGPWPPYAFAELP
jgi:hypothetical protein